MLTALAAVLVADSAAGNPPTLIYVLGAILAGGVLPLIYQAAQRWRRGPLEDSTLIAHTVNEQLGGMKELLDQYRVEIEVSKRQLEDYRKQLVEITQDLARAQVRIGHLEDELERSRARREEIERELVQLRAQYEHTNSERRSLEELTTALQERLQQLTLVTGRGDEPAGSPT